MALPLRIVPAGAPVKLTAFPETILLAEDLEAAEKLALGILWHWSDYGPADIQLKPDDLGRAVGRSAAAARNWLKTLDAKGRIRIRDRPKDGLRDATIVSVHDPTAFPLVGRQSAQQEIEWEPPAAEPMPEEGRAEVCTVAPAVGSDPSDFGASDAPAARTPQTSARSEPAVTEPNAEPQKTAVTLFGAWVARERAANAPKSAQTSARRAHDHDFHDSKLTKNHSHISHHERQRADFGASAGASESASGSDCFERVAERLLDPTGKGERVMAASSEVRRAIETLMPGLGSNPKRNVIAALVNGELDWMRVDEMAAAAKRADNPPAYFCQCLKREFDARCIAWRSK